MDKCTIYYDDTCKSSTEYAERLKELPEIECKPASAYKSNQLIYESNHTVGFLFPSDNGRLPEHMHRIMMRIIMNKKSYVLVCVTEGAREMKAIKSAVDCLNSRGYHADSIYSKYIFEKNHIADGTERILTDIREKNSHYTDHLLEMQSMSKKDLRKYVRDMAKDYRKYRKAAK